MLLYILNLFIFLIFFFGLVDEETKVKKMALVKKIKIIMIIKINK